MGQRVGYTVRFDDRTSRATRIRYVTPGVLLRRLPADPELRGISTLVFDELHERHIADDLLLAWCRRLRQTARPDLRVVAMSATLETAPLAAFLGAAVVRSEGRLHPVAIEHAERPDTRPLHVQVAAAIRRLVADGLDGDVLVFLPGVDAIRRAEGACRRVAQEADLAVGRLHGSLGPRETRDALRPAGRRKVVLATNVAESSVTLDGIAAVVDCGLHKVARSSPWTGLPALHEEPIPRDSATQRAGRAGRTGPGRCIRLYPQADLARRPATLAPEIQRADVCEAALVLSALGATDLEWLDPPEPSRWAGAIALLDRLEAGPELLALPLHPRLARLVVEARRLGAPGLGAHAAALLSEGARAAGELPAGDCDVRALIDAHTRGRLDPATADRVRRSVRALGGGAPEPGDDAADALRRAILAGFPDRVARRSEADPDALALADAGPARLGRESGVRQGRFLVAVDATADRGRPLVRLATAVEPDWLLEIPGDLTEQVEVRWVPSAQRVEMTQTLRWRGLVLESTLAAPRGRPEVTALLRQKARAAGLAAAAERDALTELLARRRVAHSADPRVPALDEEGAWDALDALCDGAASFRDLQDADLLGHLRNALGWDLRQRLDALAPTRLLLPGGHTARVVYPAEGRPRISAPIQHFFGMAQGPTLGGVPVLLELLAPSRRPVQITDDLGGFWDRTWPEVRRELRGRYPKHAWPEDPRTATPPRRR